MKAAMEEGVDLMGYTPWGCIDLISVGSGEMKKRYGLFMLMQMILAMVLITDTQRILSIGIKK